MSFPRTDDARTASLRSDTALCVPDTELVIVFCCPKTVQTNPRCSSFWYGCSVPAVPQRFAIEPFHRANLPPFPSPYSPYPDSNDLIGSFPFASVTADNLAVETFVASWSVNGRFVSSRRWCKLIMLHFIPVRVRARGLREPAATQSDCPGFSRKVWSAGP